MAYSIGIDGSTQSMSAIVIDLNNNQVICEHTINFGARLPQYNSPNGFFEGLQKIHSVNYIEEVLLQN